MTATAATCPACARCAAGGQGHSPAELARYHPPGTRARVWIQK